MTTVHSTSTELRARIAQLRQEISDTTIEYQAAKRRGDADRVIQLLRRRSALIRQLFRVQSELLASIRTPVDIGTDTVQPSLAAS